MYGVGFGSVTPNIPAVQIVGQINSLSLPLSLTDYIGNLGGVSRIHEL